MTVRIALDTNILIRLANEYDPAQAIAISALQAVVNAEHVPCDTPQNIVEFWSVATRRADQRGFGRTTGESDAKVQLFQSSLSLLPENDRIHSAWLHLVRTHAVQASKVHDTRIAAALQVHEVSHLLTWNTRDFKRFEFLTCLTPEQILAGALP